MKNLKVSKEYGAKCNLGNKEIYISTRSFSQTDSSITLDTQSQKGLKSLSFTITQMPKYGVNIAISILTKDSQIIPLGTLTNKNSSIKISLNDTDTSISKIKFVIKNSTKEQKDFVLKSIAA